MRRLNAIRPADYGQAYRGMTPKAPRATLCAQTNRTKNMTMIKNLFVLPRQYRSTYAFHFGFDATHD